MTIEIQLTQGQVTIVDDIDADLAQFKWFALNTHKAIYASRKIARDNKITTEYLHRVILSRMLDRPLMRSELVDHWHGLTLDNRRSELRLATFTQSNQNRKIRSNNTSGFKGVHWDKSRQKWTARIKSDGKEKYLGYFATAEEAYEAYCKAAREIFGEFARLE